MKKKTLITLLITLALVTSNLSAVFADDGVVPPVDGETQQEEPAEAELVAEEPVSEDVEEEMVISEEEEITDEEAEGAEPVAQEDTEPEVDAETEAETESESEQETAAETDEQPAVEESEESLVEVVEVLSAENVEVLSDEGEVLPLASEEAAEILASTDPFFWNGVDEWIGYTLDGTGCPANVTCLSSATPFQEAVTQAGAGNTVYVASGDYAEDVVINNANQSLIAFQDVTVPDAGLPTITIDSSGFAVVQSITLNVALTLNNGVYADLVTVNETGQTGGRLDDAMELVNDGGRIEADVEIYGSDGHYRVRDANHPSVNFEWECGEPNVVIYPGRTYRMTLMNPLDQTIVDYYDAHGDERNTAPWNLDLTALQRIEDLRIAVNVSEEPGGAVNWSHNNEERIYWYLLGNTGLDTHGNDITLNDTNTDGNGRTQQDWADEITNGDWDDITRYWDIWFMYPTEENGNTVSVANRQLTFLVYDPRPVFGCIDPLALNYDINADTDDQSCVYYEGCTDPAALNFDGEALVDDGSCRYESTTETPPQFIPAPLPIPVTGEDVLIPVTGIDMLDDGISTLEIAIALSGLLVVASSLVIVAKRKNEI